MKKVQIITGSGNQLYTIDFPYRFFDDDVSFIIKNEITQESETTRLVATEVNGMLQISFLYEFLEGQNFEAMILKYGTNRLIWRGSLFSTSQVDLKNYRLIKPNDDGIIIL